MSIIAFRLWSESILSSGKFWKWARLTVTSQEQVSSRMIALVPEIWITEDTDPDIVEALLKSIRAGVAVNLKKFSSFNDLSLIQPTLVSSAVQKVQRCYISDAQPGQLRALLTGLQDSSSLRSLELESRTGLYQVAPDILAGAVVNLETFQAPLLSNQAVAVLTRLALTPDARLRRLALYGSVHISHLDPEILTSALVKLESVGRDLSSGLSASQVTALVTRIRDSQDLRLKELALFCDISPLSPGLLVAAIKKLEGVLFCRARMTLEQAWALYSLVRDESIGRLKKIKLCKGCKFRL